MTAPQPSDVRSTLLRLAGIQVPLTALALTLGASSCGSAKVEELLENATVYIQVEGALREPGQTAITQQWSGSGAFVSEDGLIVTNNHVASGSVIRRVYVNGEDSPRTAVLKGVSECSDLAVLKVEGEDFPTLDWTEDPIEPGLEVFAAGYPGVTGMGKYTLTKGIVSTAPQPLSTVWASVEQAIYHDAQINSGSSGGPLISQADGSLVGVNYAGLSAENAHIAIAAEEARGIVEKLAQGIDVNSIGISGDVRMVEDEAGNALPAGVWVTAVRPGGKSDAIGIKPGDLIVELGGISLQDPSLSSNYSLENYCNVLRSNDPNTEVVPIKILRLDANHYCTGQINGKILEGEATNGQAVPCPVNPGTNDTGQTGTGDTGQTGTGDTGQTGTGDQTDPDIPTIPEQEPNDDFETAQVLTSAPLIVAGMAKQGDPALGLPEDPEQDIPADPYFGEDIFLFEITAPLRLTLALATENDADFDIYLVNSNGDIVGESAAENTGTESIELDIPADIYAIIVDAWSTVTVDTQYNLGFALQ